MKTPEIHRLHSRNIRNDVQSEKRNQKETATKWTSTRTTKKQKVEIIAKHKDKSFSYKCTRMLCCSVFFRIKLLILLRLAAILWLGWERVGMVFDDENVSVPAESTSGAAYKHQISDKNSICKRPRCSFDKLLRADTNHSMHREKDEYSNRIERHGLV